MMKRKLAVVLFNLGGPDRPEAIRPFLVNLFTDPAILRVPAPLRPFLARFIAHKRVGPATANYALLGGRSPLLQLTQQQGRALEAALPEWDTHCFIAMRYWHPFSEEAAREVLAWRPDEIVLLPLYPQYSTTTTGSSLTAWREAAARVGQVAPVATLCCYHSDPGFIAATSAIVANSLREAQAALGPETKLRVLFSAHGLPEVIVRRGDPYQYQVEESVAGVLASLGERLDSVICYQSRATPQRWIGPSTEEEIRRASEAGIAVLVVPIAFVSEHSETLVELDVEYRAVALKHGSPGYFRAPTQNADPGFIAALAALVRGLRPGLQSAGPLCPAGHRDCPHRRAGAA